MLGIDKFNCELHDAGRLKRLPQAGKENYFKWNSIVYPILAGVADGTKDIYNLSPIETSIKFDLPTQGTLPDTSLFSPQQNIDVNSLPPAGKKQTFRRKKPSLRERRDSDFGPYNC